MSFDLCMYLKCAWYVVDVLSTLDLHLPQSLNRVVTIKTWYVVVVFVRSGSPPSPSAKQSGYDKNKLRCCFIRNGSPPSPSTKQSGYDKNKVHRCDFVRNGFPPFPSTR